MAHDDSTPVGTMPTTPTGRTRPEARTVEARFYQQHPADPTPARVVIEGTVYDRSPHQAKALPLCRRDDLTEELLALVPEDARDRAGALLFEVGETFTAFSIADQEQIEAHLVEILPQHEPAIRETFFTGATPIPTDCQRCRDCTEEPGDPSSTTHPHLRPVEAESER